MKSRIPTMWLPLTLALPGTYGTAYGKEFGKPTVVYLFYANVPARFYHAVANLKMFLEQTTSTCSECNEP